jgi:hypothetical protein
MGLCQENWFDHYKNVILGLALVTNAIALAIGLGKTGKVFEKRESFKARFCSSKPQH